MRLWRKPRLDDEGIFHLRFAHRGAIGDREHELTRAPTFVVALILWVDETNAALPDALTYDYLQVTLTRFRKHISRKKGRGLFKLNVMKIGERVKPRQWQKQIVETPSGWFDTRPGFVQTVFRACTENNKIRVEMIFKEKFKKINTINSYRT